ncbi:MAG: hypothetical protein F6K09_34750, partial [Merismopedia sp. SIO2A8]|nr:hypothetical protein [Merismopedia sp. SIO2A8]
MTSFTRSQTVQELYFLSEAVVETVPYSIAFWVDELEVEGAPNPTLEATWKTGKGIYLFLKVAANGDNAIDHLILSTRISEFLSTPSVSNTRFLWIDNPQDSVAQLCWAQFLLSVIESRHKISSELLNPEDCQSIKNEYCSLKA